MVHVDFETKRAYDARRFTAQTVFESGRMEVVLGYFAPGQFVPVHAPESEVVIAVQSGTVTVRDGGEEHEINSGDVVVVGAGTARGVRTTEDARMEALLVTAPPPTDGEHDPVRRGIRENTFDPRTQD